MNCSAGTVPKKECGLNPGKFLVQLDSTVFKVQIISLHTCVYCMFIFQKNMGLQHLCWILFTSFCYVSFWFIIAQTRKSLFKAQPEKAQLPVHACSGTRLGPQFRFSDFFGSWNHGTLQSEDSLLMAYDLSQGIELLKQTLNDDATDIGSKVEPCPWRFSPLRSQRPRLESDRWLSAAAGPQNKQDGRCVSIATFPCFSSK